MTRSLMGQNMQSTLAKPETESFKDTYFSDVDCKEFELPGDYEEAYDLAGTLLQLDNEIPRYQANINPKWREAELSVAWRLSDYNSIAAEITLRGDRISGRSKLVGPRFHQSKRYPRLRQNQEQYQRFSIIVDDTEIMYLYPESVETFTLNRTELLLDDEMLSTMTMLPQDLYWPKNTRTRGNCRGYSLDSHENLCKRLDERLPGTECLVGRVILATLSPVMSRSAAQIKLQMNQLKKTTKQLAKKYGVWILFRLGFGSKSQNWKPHSHLFIVMPLGYTVEQCRILSAKLRKEFDREWRKINHFGIMKDGWKLKSDEKSVNKAIYYLKRHETHEKAYGSWDRPWIEFGDITIDSAYRISVSAPQMKKVWAALCHYQGIAEHPWACNFKINNVDPKLLFMLLLRVGVSLPQELIDFYLDPL
jgi:hypothetical protein